MIHLLVMLQLFFGASPKTCFKDLERKNYEQALECFNSCIQNDPQLCEAYYGKALVLCNKEYASYNFDSAYYYVRKGENKYLDLSIKQQDELKEKLSISSSSFVYLRKNITIDALGAIDKNNIQALQKFIAYYADERLVSRAQEYIDEIQIFSKIPLNKDISFYEMLINKYPNNDSINTIWKLYYDLYTSDGSALTYLKFKLTYPDSPLSDVLERDSKVAQIAERYKLLVKKVTQNQAFYNEYIRKAAPRYQAYVALVVFIKEYIDAAQWQKAYEIANAYRTEFGNNSYYLSLLRMLQSNESPIYPQSIGDGVNTDGQEFSPVMNAAGNKLYFGGLQRTDNIGGEDIYISELVDSKWQPAQIVSSVSTQSGNEAPEAVSIDETRLLLFADGDILLSTATNEGWSQPQLFPSINTRLWEGDGMLTADGNAIIFASESWEKLGVQYPAQNREDLFDIYISIKSPSGKWSRPINLGTKVNSPYCDRYPYLHPDMKTLYFSSRGHGGFGGTDVYKCVRLNDTSWTQWSEPVNLGKYINTSGNDNGYKVSTDGAMAYFSTIKQNIDIYTIQLPNDLRPNLVMVVEGKVTDEKGTPLEASILVEDLTTGQQLGEYMSHPITGAYTMTLPIGRQYGYYVSKKFYFPVSENIDLRKISTTQIFKHDFVIQSIKTILESKVAIRINNIFFETDKFDLKPESYAELNRLAMLIQANETYIFKIEGHTDNMGEVQYNQKLSNERAKAVMNYLIARGCKAESLSYIGFGQDKPIALNSLEQGRAQNRRVEIRMELKK